MEVLLIVSNPDSGPIASGFAGACVRAGIDWGAFFTNDGVKVLADPAFLSTLKKAKNAVSCLESWDKHMQGACPLEEGSQTNNSALMAQARRVVSL